MITDEMIETAAEAIFETWREREGADTSWPEALKAHGSPNEFPKLCRAVGLVRAEAKSALTAALSKVWRPIEEAPKGRAATYGYRTQFGGWHQAIFLNPSEPKRYGYTHYAELLPPPTETEAK